MSDLKTSLREMAELYGDYAERLSQWMSLADSIDDSESRLENLAAMETKFMKSIRRVGEEAESERAKRSRALGKDISLKEAARTAGAAKECTAAEKAVAKVSRLRVETIRRLESMRDGIREERGKISRARKLNRKYTPVRENGRRLNGQA